jgi:hypothetical protein
MKQNANKMSVEARDQDSSLHIVEAPNEASGAKTIVLPSACHAPQPRPEIAVLGWDVRSYRLALRENKI